MSCVSSVDLRCVPPELVALDTEVGLLFTLLVVAVEGEGEEGGEVEVLRYWLRNLDLSLAVTLMC